MFVLRVINEGQPPINKAIGDQYSYLNKAKDRKRFEIIFNTNPAFSKEYIEEAVKTDYESSECYGFIYGTNCLEPIALFESQEAYIMTEGGKTFENVSFYSS